MKYSRFLLGFSGLETVDNPYVQVPPGEYRVVVTLAKNLGEAHPGNSEAYASLAIDETLEETQRRFLHPTENGHVEDPDLCNFGTNFSELKKSVVSYYISILHAYS